MLEYRLGSSVRYARVLLETVADLECGNPLRQPRGELGVDGRLNVDSVGADASLT